MSKLSLKKISYVSAMLIATGGTIGAGIFVKNFELFNNTGGSFIYVICAWIVGALGVLAIGLSIMEVSSGSDSDGGILDWVRKFCPKWMTRFSSTNLLLIYYPFGFFAMPVYAVLSFNHSIGYILNGYQIAIISFLLFAWLVTISYKSLNIAEKFQWIFTVAKFLPLIALPFFGIFQASKEGIVYNNTLYNSVDGFTGLAAWMGLFASIPAILFAFEGFHVATALRSKIKNPKNIGKITFWSIVIIIATYLFFAISLGSAGAGKVSDLHIVRNNVWVQKFISIIISIAILGIVNGLAISNVPFFLSVHKNKDIGIIRWFKNKFNISTDKQATFWTTFFISTIIFWLLTALALFAWHEPVMENNTVNQIRQSALNMRGMASLVTNFTSIVLFIIILFSVAGAMFNRRSKKIKVNKKKYFIPSAIIAIIFIGIAFLYMIIEVTANMFILDGSDQVTAIIKFLILLVSIIISFLPEFKLKRKSLSKKRMHKKDESKIKMMAELSTRQFGNKEK